jgi:hypothetical protein
MLTAAMWVSYKCGIACGPHIAYGVACFFLFACGLCSGLHMQLLAYLTTSYLPYSTLSENYPQYEVSS